MDRSLPARERGLKLLPPKVLDTIYPSLPARERGLKPGKVALPLPLFRSLPARERGLKPFFTCLSFIQYGSLPARERGLKHKLINGRRNSNIVAPRAGAWIETYIHALIVRFLSVAPRAGAWIETCTETAISTPQRCRSPRGSVD